jgi:Icc-related predicted phosphoesterase
VTTNPFSSNHIRILLSGDTHGDEDLVPYLFSTASDNSVDAIYQLGDFGYFPNIPRFARFLAQVSSLATLSGIPVFFIDGNHDDHFSLNPSRGFKCHSFVTVSSNVFWIPRGHLWSVAGVRFAALGGAYSVDRFTRTVGRDIFPDLERPVPSDFTHMLDHTCDVLLTHDAPYLIDIGKKVIYEESESTRRTIDALVESMSPAYLFHGHHHKRYSSGIRTTQVHGLGCELDNMFGLLDCAGSASFSFCAPAHIKPTYNRLDY